MSCYQYQQTGHCNFGLQCKYAHEPINHAAFPAYGAFATPQYRTQTGTCYQFQETGQCRFGNACRFSHHNGESATSAAAFAPGAAGVPLFPHFPNNSVGSQAFNANFSFNRPQFGYLSSYSQSSYGIRSGYASTNPGPCYQFQETGLCKYGDTCRFSHGNGHVPGRGGSQLVCYQFRETGQCAYGDSCRFSHASDAKKEGVPADAHMDAIDQALLQQQQQQQ